jgi:hypothetical protein
MNQGQHYKIRTRDWYRKQGYVSELVEKLQVIRRGKQTVYVKKDLLGADVIACNDTETILANAVLGKSNVSKHIKEFEKYPSGGLKRVVVIWQKNAREPEIRRVKDGVRNKASLQSQVGT